jgi:glycerate kinase
MCVTNPAAVRRGLGFAPRRLGAQFKAGVVVAELVGLAELVEGADLVITGEGRFDAQTLRGKTPFGVARIAREHGVPVIVIAGTLGEDYQDLYAHGIDAAFALPSGPMTLEQACFDAPRLLRERATDIAGSGRRPGAKAKATVTRELAPRHTLFTTESATIEADPSDPAPGSP